MNYPFFKVVNIPVEEINEKPYTDVELQSDYVRDLQKDILLNGIWRPVLIYRSNGSNKFKVQNGFNRFRSMFNPEINKKLNGLLPCIIINRSNACIASQIICAAAHKGLPPLATLHLGHRAPKMVFA
jgi:hypothetical protein